MWENVQPNFELDTFIAEHVMGWSPQNVAENEISFQTDRQNEVPEILICTNDRTTTQFSPSLFARHLTFALSKIPEFVAAYGTDASGPNNPARAFFQTDDVRTSGDGETPLLALCMAIKTFIDARSEVVEL